MPEELILHHYDQSPFSEKVRLMLGFKALTWRSVIVPSIMPKPDLVPLTGGYRRTPVLQIGADVYCDTRRIALELDRRFPVPSLFPGGRTGHAQIVGHWADRELFWAVARFVTGIRAADRPMAFHEDRARMWGVPVDLARMQAAVPRYRQQLRGEIGWIAEVLSNRRPFMLGQRPSAADLAVYHCLWYVRDAGEPGEEMLAPYAVLRAWMARVAEIGHGERSELTAAEAIEIARAASPQTAEALDPEDPDGLAPGMRVKVAPIDYGKDPAVGRIVAVSAETVAIRRRDPWVGDIVVHFPRVGFLVSRA